ncbi:hypothetical protein BH18THE2_BH18THE2_37980 [soil metagenome]
MNKVAENIRNRTDIKCAFCGGIMKGSDTQPRPLFEEFICTGCGFEAYFVERNTKWLDNVKIGD